MAASTAATSVPRSVEPDRAFLGHPKGLAYLAFTEAWERFSYYGMVSLLVLYMVNQLLLPGHIEQIVGFAGFRAAMERLFGPLSIQALASQIFGLYAGFVYFTPVIGGWIGDRWIGQRNAVVLGALSMSGGHVAMAFDESFLLALLLLVVGSGLLKGNISAQVGGLYLAKEEARRTRAFAIFSTGINFGAVMGPLFCGFLGARYGWHMGFGAAALLMLGALATYLKGFRHLPAKIARSQSQLGPLSSEERKVVAALVVVMMIAVLAQIAYYQLANVHPVWLQQHADLNAAGFEIPIPWFYSIDPLVSILSVPALFALWNRQARVGREPRLLTKIAIGSCICGGANLVLVAAIALSPARVMWVWPVLYCTIQGVGFMYFWPNLLALVSRAAPPKINATMMGVSFLTLFVGNNLIGRIGTFYEQMTPMAFWAIHAGIGTAGGILLLVFKGRLECIISPARGLIVKP
jgi:POT family proton-dependent oligopeptide transporter